MPQVQPAFKRRDVAYPVSAETESLQIYKGGERGDIFYQVVVEVKYPETGEAGQRRYIAQSRQVFSITKQNEQKKKTSNKQ